MRTTRPHLKEARLKRQVTALRLAELETNRSFPGTFQPGWSRGKMTIQPGYLDKKQSSVYVSESKRTLDYARSSGDLPYYRVGRKILFRVSDLDEWMAQFRVDVTELKEPEEDS